MIKRAKPRTPFKVLIAHHRWWFPTFVNGADLANHEFACALKRQGVDVRVFGITPPGNSRRAPSRRYVADGVPICLVTSDFIRQLSAELEAFKPDVVLTSCPEPSASADDVRRMINAISRVDLPTVLFVHDIEGTLPLFNKVKKKLAKIITNSRFMADRIEELWSAQCEVVYPVPDWRSFNSGPSTGPFITFFNPSPHKGLSVAHGLVTQRFPDRPFLFVEGFIDPEAHGISLSRSGNLVHARCSPDVETIYMMTRTLIVPSQWEEPFGRVALEAMYKHVPVIASKTGGLLESVGDGGIIIDDFAGTAQWAEAITRLDDPKERRRIIEAGKKHVRKFSLQREAKKLLEILRGVTT